MVFVPDPYGNEPGRENLREGEESKRYNRMRYPETVQFGMIEWIEGKRSLTPDRVCIVMADLQFLRQLHWSQLLC